MARWSDLAEWRGPTVNQTVGHVEVRGLIIHIADGGYEGTIAWQCNPAADVSSHFVTSTTGMVAQIVDTDDTAWTQRAGNGHWLSVENAGHTPNALTDAQCEAIAQLLARGHLVYGYPLQLADSPDGMGLGHHSMGTFREGWAGATWGHEFCPGEAIKAQKPAILARAIEIVNGADMDAAQSNALTDCLNILTAMGNGLDQATVHDKDGVLNLAPFYRRIAQEVAQLPSPVATVDTEAIADAVLDAEAARLAE